MSIAKLISPFVLCVVASVASSSALAQSSASLPIAVKFQLGEVDNARLQVEKFQPGVSAFIVDASGEEWLLRAVSNSERKKWADGFFKSSLVGKDEFWKRLDGLAKVAADKIPLFTPNPKNFAYHNGGEEALMKAQLGDSARAGIREIGLAQADWTVQKNSLDIIQKRYKTGYVWVKDSSDDFPYCRLHQVNIIQDYAGAGTYGASQAVSLANWLVGCQLKNG